MWRNMDSLLLDFEEVARLITFSPATVANWAYRRKPSPQGFPKPVKIGRILRFRRKDIEDWIVSLGVVESRLASAQHNSDEILPVVKRSRGRPRLREAVDRG
jgi:predicted DNA-binding transcriptional regulator AlpA